MNTKEAILQETIRLTNEKGWNSTGFREIARSLDISPGNLSYHYRKKEDLLNAILHIFNDECSDIIDKSSHENASIRQFLKTMERLLQVHLSYRGILMAQYVFLRNEPVSSGQISRDSEWRNKYRTIFHRLAATGELRASEEDVYFLGSFMEMFMRSWMFDHKHSEEDIIRKSLYLLSQQLYYFGTEKGIGSIDQFLEYMEVM